MTTNGRRARERAAQSTKGVSSRARRAQIDRLFTEFPAAERLYAHVRDYIASLGDVKIVPRKTQVGFSHGRLFAWIWLPQRWIKQAPRDGITLTISLNRRVTDPRIKEYVEPYPGRHVHHIVITRQGELDARVRAWLREAYDLAALPRQRVRRKTDSQPDSRGPVNQRDSDVEAVRR